jgi:hypothetical protein
MKLLDAWGYSQNIAPAFHPLLFAVAKHPARVEAGINPLLASPAEAGLPMTSLLRGTPANELISNTEVWTKSVWDVVRRELQVV